MSAEARFEPDQILRSLNAEGVRYVVVGGIAVTAHGVVRATADLDLVVERSRENAAALERALHELDARDLAGRDEPIARDALVRRADRRPLTRHGEVHLLHEVDGVPDYEALQPAVEFEVAGVRFQAASLAALRALKRAADRAKGRIDLSRATVSARPASRPSFAAALPSGSGASAPSGVMTSSSGCGASAARRGATSSTRGTRRWPTSSPRRRSARARGRSPAGRS